MLQGYIDEIKRRLKEQNISIGYMAEDIGINRKTIYNFLSGTNIINAMDFLIICDYLGIELWGNRNDRQKRD